MEAYTTQPGVQFYTGFYVNATGGKGGVNYGKFSGFCLETQNYPDAPNKVSDNRFVYMYICTIFVTGCIVCGRRLFRYDSL